MNDSGEEVMVPGDLSMHDNDYLPSIYIIAAHVATFLYPGLHASCCFIREETLLALSLLTQVYRWVQMKH